MIIVTILIAFIAVICVPALLGSCMPAMFIAAVLSMTGGIIWASVQRKKNGGFLNPLYICVGALLLSVFYLLAPYSLKYVAGEKTFIVTIKTIKEFFEGLFVNFVASLQVFTLDADIDKAIDFFVHSPNAVWFNSFYTCVLRLAAAVAPVFTLTVIVSFLSTLSAKSKFYSSRNCKERNIFSSLNKKTIALAKSIRKGDSKCVIAFAGVESKFGFEAELKELKAICLRDDILDLKLEPGKHKMCVFVCGEDDSENTLKSVTIMENLAKCKKNGKTTSLYVFTKERGAITIIRNTEKRLSFDNNSEAQPVLVIIVNEARSFILNHVYRTCEELIKLSPKAAETPDDCNSLFDKQIVTYNNSLEPEQKMLAIRRHFHAVIVGLGEYGREMTKTLLWYFQLLGFCVEIDCYEMDEHASDKLAAEMPEFFPSNDESPDDNKLRYGDAYYKLNVHDNTDVKTKSFVESIKQLSKVSYVFIALGGSDEANIEVASNIYSAFTVINTKPRIDVVVSDSEKCRYMCQTLGVANCSIKNESGDEMVRFVGDVDSIYSINVFSKKGYIREVEKIHKSAGDEVQLWENDYAMRSSIAAIAHSKGSKIAEKMLADEGEVILDNDKIVKYDMNERTLALSMIEHNRWCNYVRTEGWIYSGSTNRSSRNDLAKLHNCLTVFDKLDAHYQQKDVTIVTRREYFSDETEEDE